MLTDALRKAARDGLIARHLDAGRFETATLYELTALGRSLDEPLAVFDHWVATMKLEPTTPYVQTWASRILPNVGGRIVQVRRGVV